jgi:hypothetical protein
MSRVRAYNWFVLVGSIALAFTQIPPSYASLGGVEESVSVDAAALSARELSVKSRPGYTIHEMSSASATIREYLNSSGVVFGVAWSGMRHPDLTALLGSRHAEYQAAAQEQPKQHGKHTRSIKSANVVVETWGHMRKLQGHAYDPSLLPSEASAHEIQ